MNELSGKVREHWMLSAIREMIRGWADWHRWAWLGLYDVRLLNRRSMIGMWWPVLSMAIFVFGVGHLFSMLLGRPIDVFLPHIAVGWLIWQLINAGVVQGAGVFVDGRQVLQEALLPANTLALRLLTRLAVQLLMSSVVIAAAFAYVWKPVSLVAPMALLGLALNLLVLHGVVLFAGLLCTWMRDLEKLIEAGMRLAFFMTPIIWMPDPERAGRSLLIDFNPFYYMIEVVRAPLVDGVIPVQSLAIVSIGAVAANLCALLVFAWARRRVIYWL